jgi:hypothetical protein
MASQEELSSVSKYELHMLFMRESYEIKQVLLKGVC